MNISPVTTTTQLLSFATRRTHCGGLWANALGAITAARLVVTIRTPVSANAELVWGLAKTFRSTRVAQLVPNHLA
jgi:hypothetical protein